jgi:RimJ/RimL family protein N-acetyltransferase
VNSIATSSDRSAPENSSVGFVIEGTHRDSARGSNGYWSSHTMALLEPDYRRLSAQ